jgi:hypothetical protein
VYNAYTHTQPRHLFLLFQGWYSLKIIQQHATMRSEILLQFTDTHKFASRPAQLQTGGTGMFAKTEWRTCIWQHGTINREIRLNFKTYLSLRRFCSRRYKDFHKDDKKTRSCKSVANSRNVLAMLELSTDTQNALGNTQTRITKHKQCVDRKTMPEVSGSFL